MYSKQLHKAIEKYNLTAENIYNWDEKGFIIGLLQTTKRVMLKEVYDSRRVRQAVQDGSREFITLLACISAISKALPPALIYKGESYDLQDTWVDEVGDQDHAHFAASSNGWSNDAFGLKWLEQIFYHYTRRTARNRRRLLIVDGQMYH